MRQLLLLCLVTALALAEIKSISDIRKEFAHIQRFLKSYKTSWEHTSASTAHIEEVSYSDQKGNIRLVEVTMTNEKERQVGRYYFSKQQLFFASKMQYQQQKLISTQKLYFIGNQMVRWIKDDKSIDPQSKVFQLKAKETQEFAQFLIQKD